MFKVNYVAKVYFNFSFGSFGVFRRSVLSHWRSGILVGSRASLVFLANLSGVGNWSIMSSALNKGFRCETWTHLVGSNVPFWQFLPDFLLQRLPCKFLYTWGPMFFLGVPLR